MTDEMKFAIEVGMRVMVKVAAREIPATVMEVGDDYFVVRSETSGKQFRTRRVVDILEQPDSEEAEAVLEEREPAADLRRRGENEPDPPPSAMPGTDMNDEAEEDRQENGTMLEEQKEEAVAVNRRDADEAMETSVAVDAPAEDKAEDAPGGDAAAGQPDVETEIEGVQEEQHAEETGIEAVPAEKPKKNLSLVDAAVEVLKAEKRPMNVREMVRLAVERGLWIPTKCKTPEQSLYGGLYLDMKNSAAPRVKKSAEKGKFELA